MLHTKGPNGGGRCAQNYHGSGRAKTKPGFRHCHVSHKERTFSPVAKESMSVSYHIKFTWDRVLSFPQFNFKKQAPAELLIYYNKSFETEMEQMIIEIKSLPYNIGKK